MKLREGLFTALDVTSPALSDGRVAPSVGVPPEPRLALAPRPAPARLPRHALRPEPALQHAVDIVDIVDIVDTIYTCRCWRGR